VQDVSCEALIKEELGAQIKPHREMRGTVFGADFEQHAGNTASISHVDLQEETKGGIICLSR